MDPYDNDYEIIPNILKESNGFKKARKLMTKEELQNHHSRNSRPSIKPPAPKQTRFGAPDSDSESDGG